jgi:protein TonB
MSKQEGKAILPFVLIGCCIAAVGFGAILLVRSFLASEAPAPKKVVQEIRLIRPPPPEELPPPPPPPPEEEVDVPEPEQRPDPVASNEPPPADLGLDADGTAGGDAFGLVGRKGGRDLLASGSGLAWYATLLKGEILEQIKDADALLGDSSSIEFQAWIRPDGRVERVRLMRSTGDRKRDSTIETALTRLTFSQGPPANAPQPVTLKFGTRA